MRKSLFPCLVLAFHAMFGCSAIRHNLVEKRVAIRSFDVEREPTAQETVTVWVHGTSQNPLIRKWHASPQGTTHFDDLPETWALKTIGQELHAHDSFEFSQRGFYTFGWSGKLSFSAREEAGRQLDIALRTIVNDYRMRSGQKPRIRLITHSHGCNVALNGSDSFTEGEYPIEIEEFVMLACPVQQVTVEKLKSKAFKQIFALYSTADLIQVLDPQGLYREGRSVGAKLFSERRFENQSNLIQAQIRWEGFGLSHIGFVRQRFAQALPSILAELRSSTTRDFLIDVHPKQSNS